MSEAKLNSNEIAYFSGQMALMISSGITILEALRLLEAENGNRSGKAILHGLVSEVESGQHLYDAMSISGVFPDYVLKMVNIGEQTGKLEEIFSSLSSYYENNENISADIKSAVTYPFIMIMMMLAVIFVLMVKVMPIFEQVYRQLGSSMTGFSAGVLNFGKVLGTYSIIFIAVFTVILIAFLFFSISEKGRTAFSSFAAGFRPTRKLCDEIAAGRFAGGMALALSSGYNTVDGLALVSGIIANKYYVKKIEACREYIKEGESLGDAFVKSEVFPGTYGRMASIGFKSGKLDEVMKGIAARYEAEADRKIMHFIAILEPTLVAVLSVIVGLVLLSVMLPLMGIMSSIG